MVTIFSYTANEDDSHADGNQDAEKLKHVIDRYVYTGKVPLPDPDIIDLITQLLKLAERAPTRKRVLKRIMDYVMTFIREIAA